MQDEFLEAWRVWDEACSRYARKGTRTTALALVNETAKLEDTSRLVAESLDLPVTTFREQLAVLRRNGHSREEALHEIRSGQSTSQPSKT